MTAVSAASSQQQTLDYYNTNAGKFVASTANVEFGQLQGEFARRLPEGGCILDLGCGSGRDSLAFTNAGFAVVPVDGSQEMCAATRELTGLEVTHATFQEYEPQGQFDGIWACSSLLHVPLPELPDVVAKYARALRPGGTFYLSFKLGNFQGMRNGRWFTDLTEREFRQLIGQIPELRVDSIGITADVRPGRGDEQWLNAWCVRV
ncbi:MAG: class I SAM-dependent methyltransferase [Coriobacteriia bacterium]|nr:class I SAM-dependent methyltransferase [Coriobacteriia bacterium]